MNISKSLVAAAVAAVLAGATGVAAAGELAGRVTDSSTGRPLPNATVRIPELNRTVQADRSGAFLFTDLPAGTFTVEAAFVGFSGGSESATVGATGLVSRNLELRSLGVEEVTVTGFRFAQATALQNKKSADVIKESVTANDAGKLPDQNAAEALVRLTGVSVTTDQSEGRYVTIRGIDAALNNVTLDGQTIGSPEGDTRRVALDTVPANILSKLEVIKTVTPDLDANSIGGIVNLVTPSAFDDADGRFFSAAAEVGYFELGGQNPWGASASWGQLFANDTFSVVLSASYSDREYNSENLQGGEEWDAPSDEPFLIPEEQVLRDYLIRRVREGFVANFDWRPTEVTRVYLHNLYSRYEDTELQPEITFDYQNGDLEDQTATSGLFTEGEGTRANSERYEVQSILSTTLGTVLNRGAWTYDLSATYGETEQDTPYDNGYVFELDDALPMTYDTSGFFWFVSAPDEFQDADGFEFEEAFRGGQNIKEEIWAGKVDIQRDLEWSGDRSGYVKFGGKYLSRESTSDQDMIVYDGFDGDDDWVLSSVAQPGNPSFYTAESPNYPFGPYPNYNLSEEFFAANESDFEINAADTIAESFGVDYRVKEDVAAGYLMGAVTSGNVTWVGGLRVEHTETDFDAYSIQFVDGDPDGLPTPVTGSKDYTNWLPGLNVIWRMQEDLILRAAWTNTIGRPSYEQNVPFRIFDSEESEDDPGEFEGEIEAGNPDLDPLESMNWDVALEWYLLPAGILSGGFFHKSIDDPIYTQIFEIEDEIFEGRFYQELTIFQPQNAEKGSITGVELAYQQQFSNLPGFWRGFGVSLSYTYTQSDAQVFDRQEDVPFFLQSEHVGNVSLYYELSGLELRLAYAYRSDYLNALGETAEQDIYVADHGQLDFKASYDFPRGISAFIQFQNLTNEPLRYYSGVSSQLAENEFYEWNMLAGVAVQF